MVNLRTIETVFRTIVSVNQLSIYGAVSEMCEECASCHNITGRLVVAGQSDPLFVPKLFALANSLIMTPRPWIEIPAHENLLQKERVERLPQQDRLIKICTDAGFLKTVEVGQYFMTEHTGGFLQFAEPVTCREYTLPRDEKSTDPKGWSRGNTKIGPMLEVTASYLQGKMEWKLELNLWKKTILTRGSEFLMDWTGWSQTWSTKSTTTTSRKPLKRRRKYLRWRRKYLHMQANQRLKQNREDLPLLAHLQELYLFMKEHGLTLNQELNSRRTWSDLILETQRWSSEQIWALSMLVWWNVEEYNGKRRRQQEKISILYWPVRTRNSLPASSSRSFRTQSHWSIITGQCVNSRQFLRLHLSHRVCNQFTLHHKFRIDTGRSKF